jgi:hypothetical protein
MGILHDLHEARVLWWTLRAEDLVEKVHYPVTTSADEWAKELHALDKILVEGFVISELRSLVTKTGRTFDSHWQSIKLIEEILLGFGQTEDQKEEIVGPLKELHFLRSKISGHVSGEEAKQIKVNVLKRHKTFPFHFRQLCTECDGAVRALQTQLEAKHPPSSSLNY